ncbi:MAG: hypothetical protein OCD03_17005, partial [Hyphomicrobiales bacterium]
MTVGGNWDVTNLTHNNGEVLLSSALAQSVISNDETFYDLTKSGVGAATFTGLLLADRDVIINGGSIVLDTGASSVTRNISGAGELDAVSATSLNVDGYLGTSGTVLANFTSATTTTVAGDWDVTVLTHNSGTVNFDGVAQAFATNNQTFQNVTKSTANTVTVTGNLTLL